MAIPVFAKQRDKQEGGSFKRHLFDLYSGALWFESVPQRRLS
jgi:hypothetical protein